MKTVILPEPIENFGTNIRQREIDEMLNLVDEGKILNVFRNMNNIFGNNSDFIHIDAEYLTSTHLYKVDVQRKKGDRKTIGTAFITQAVKDEIDSTERTKLDKLYHSLYENLKNALERSMKEIMNKQTQGLEGTSQKYIICTNAGN